MGALIGDNLQGASILVDNLVENKICHYTFGIFILQRYFCPFEKLSIATIMYSFCLMANGIKTPMKSTPHFSKTSIGKIVNL